MGSVVRLRGVELMSQRWLLRELGELCRRDLLPAHCYAVYYLTREPDRTEILVASSGSSIESYALVWHGGRFTIMDIYEVHLWRPSRDLVLGISIPPSRRADIQLYEGVSGDIGMVKNHFRELGFREFDVMEFHDMLCDRESFKPSPLERLAVKLGEEHAPLYKDLELERGIEITVDEAREILKEYTHYGVIVDNVLASVAARYVTLPDLHILGGVFTRKRYRGRGYAKAATSALTREVVNSGAHACLHVETDYDAAIKMYNNLGYKVARTRPWIFAYP